MKIFKRIIKISFFVVVLFLFVVSVSLIINKIKTNSILNDYSSIYENDKYEKSYYINNIEPFEQKVSCGYAVIELFSKWDGGNITEQSLFDTYNKVVTSTGKSFEEEMNKQFSKYNTKMYKYLKNTELIDKVYHSLENGIPVPFEWAAKYKDNWTLHYSLIIGINVKSDKIKVANPYGYVEEISIKEFLDRTSFKAFENMPLFYKLAFSFGIFEKNTIFIVER